MLQDRIDHIINEMESELDILPNYYSDTEKAAHIMRQKERFCGMAYALYMLDIIPFSVYTRAEKKAYDSYKEFKNTIKKEI